MLTTLLKNYALTKCRKFNSRESLENWQNQKVITHLKWVIKHSPFYQELYQGLSLSSWKDFPIITKKEMMEHFDTLNTCGIQKDEAFKIAIQAEETRLFYSSIGDITVGLSSGTSGNRGLFLVSPHERYSWAGTILANLLPNCLLFPQKIALFMRANSKLYTTIKSKIIRFQYYDLFRPFEKHIAELNQNPPSILIAPPSMLRQLATAIKNKTLRIAPKKIISIAEVLDPIDENYVSNIFQKKVHQIYQATEGFLATTCECGTLHLNEDLLVIQKNYLDKGSGRFQPIITDFNRFSQPILRYLLNDTLIEKHERCPCGSVMTAIECIEGRSDDTFLLPAKTGLQELIPIFPDFIRREIMCAEEAIVEYKAVQHATNKIEIFLSVPKSLKEKTMQLIKQRLSNLFESLGAKSPEILFSNERIINHQQKLRRIERKFS